MQKKTNFITIIFRMLLMLILILCGVFLIGGVLYMLDLIPIADEEVNVILKLSAITFFSLLALLILIVFLFSRKIQLKPSNKIIKEVKEDNNKFFNKH